MSNIHLLEKNPMGPFSVKGRLFQAAQPLWGKFPQAFGDKISLNQFYTFLIQTNTKFIPYHGWKTWDSSCMGRTLDFLISSFSDILYIYVDCMLFIFSVLFSPVMICGYVNKLHSKVLVCLFWRLLINLTYQQKEKRKRKKKANLVSHTTSILAVHDFSSWS